MTQTESIVSFSAVAQIILSNTIREYGDRDFMAFLCDGIPVEPDYLWDTGNFSRMVHGKRQIFPKVSEYYHSQRGFEELLYAVEDALIHNITDVPKLLSELERLVRSDGTISTEKREELLEGEDAEVIAKVLQFSIIRQEQSVNTQSPKIEKLFRKAAITRADKHFVGREAELAGIKEQLEQDNLLFVTGAPGVGKRSLARQYACNNRRRYTNRLYIPYHDSVRETIADLWCVEDSFQETEDVRFYRHFRLLSCLDEDSLLVIAGMDVLPEKDESFELLFQLGCHVIVTTELEMEQENRLVLCPFDDREELILLFDTYCPRRKLRDSTEEDVLRLVKLLGGHTYAVQLLALTVKEGFVTVPELTALIESQGMCAIANPIEVKRGYRYQYDSYTEILSQVLQIQNLREGERNALANFSMMPLTGIGKARFGKWTGQKREIQRLIRLGWIQEDENSVLTLNRLVREMTSETLRPDAANCKALLDGMAKECRRCKEDEVLELLACVGSVSRRIWNSGKEYFPYLTVFLDFMGRNCCDSTEQLARLIPEERRAEPEGRTLLVLLRVLRLLGSETRRLAQNGTKNTPPDYHGEDRVLYTEMKELIQEVDDKAAGWLRIACYTLANLVMMGQNIALLIDLIRLKDELNRRFALPVPHDYDGDVVLLWGALDLLYEKPEMQGSFVTLLKQKREESVQNGDSQLYMGRLDTMEAFSRTVGEYEDNSSHQEAMFGLMNLVPGIAGQIRRIK